MTMLTQTWQHRLHSTRGLIRKAGLAIGLTSCTVVAAATIWGWINDGPIDVAGPARTAVNRTALIGAYATDCVTRWLTVTQTRADDLRDCWTLRDDLKLPTTAAVVVAAPAVSAITLVNDTGDVQQWSVVVSVNERPYESASARTTFYRLAVSYSSYGVRATALPARVNGPGPGADLSLGYPVSVAATNPAFTAVAGFLTSYLTGTGGLDRYVSADAGLLPAADYRSATITGLQADHSAPEDTVPPNGTRLHILASTSIVTSQFAPRHETYPLTLTVISGRWTVSALDYAPLLADDTEPTPVLPAVR